MRILCKIPHASKVINGVNFIEHKLGMVSEEISEDVAAVFLKIDGYLEFPSAKKATSTYASSKPTMMTIAPVDPGAQSPAQTASDSATDKKSELDETAEQTGDQVGDGADK